jgi:hypothetical protein
VISYDMERARQAVQYLVNSSYTHHHIKKLRSTVTRPRAMPFSGEIEFLNELLVIGRQNLQALENLIALVDSKHDSKGDYQRQYMAAKRKRERKVLLLEELMTGRPVLKEHRGDILHRQHLVWNKERDAQLAQWTDLNWADRNAKLKQFWDRKEAELDALIAEAREHGPIKRKRVVHVPKVPKTEFGKKLVRVLDKH